jgi:hypothetical protein
LRYGKVGIQFLISNSRKPGEQMNDYAHYKTTVFIDSNVILEGLALRDLPWGEIDPIGPIAILLTPKLLKEIDSKKQNGRLAVRAREFNRLVTPLAINGGKITVVGGPPKVDVLIAECRRIDWSKYEELDPQEGDDRIIAEIIHVEGVADQNKLLISQDINPLVMAKRYGLCTHHLGENWLPRPEPSPQEKEIAKLKRQVNDFTKNEPDFNIAIEFKSDDLETLRVKPLSENEIEEISGAIIAANPQQSQGNSSDPLYRAQYDYSLDERYEEYVNRTVPDCVGAYHEKLQLIFGQRLFSVTVKNVGKVRADHLNIDVQMIGGRMNSKLILCLFAPKGPRAKNPLTTLHTGFSRPSPPAPPLGRHEVACDEPGRKEHFSAQCENFRLGQEWKYEGVAWIDPIAAGEVMFAVSVTAANLHGIIVERLKISSTVTEYDAFDLLDKSSFILKKAFPLQVKMSELVAARKFDSYEMDGLTKKGK